MTAALFFWISFDNTSNRCDFFFFGGGAPLGRSKRNVFLAIVIACFFVDTARKQGRHKKMSPPFTQVVTHLNDHSPCSSFCIVCRHAGALVFFCEGKPTRAVWRTTSLQNGECMCGELSVSASPSRFRSKLTNNMAAPFTPGAGSPSRGRASLRKHDQAHWIDRGRRARGVQEGGDAAGGLGAMRGRPAPAQHHVRLGQCFGGRLRGAFGCRFGCGGRAAAQAT